MRTKIYICSILILASAVLCSAQSAIDSRFPEVGKSFQVEFITQSVVGEKFVQYGVSIPNGSIVKVVAHTNGPWCLVEHLRRIGVDEKTKKMRFKKEQVWLNFGNLIVVREATKEQVEVQDVIIE